MATCNITGDGIVTRAYIRLSHPRLNEGKAFVSLLACNERKAFEYVKDFAPQEGEVPMKLLWNPPTGSSPLVKCSQPGPHEGHTSLRSAVQANGGSCPICGSKSFVEDVVRRFVQPGASDEDIHNVLSLYPFMG